MSGQSTGRQQASQIFLVEDHPGVRRGFNLLLSREPDLDVCGEAEDADEAFAQIRDLHPDLAIVDLTLKQSSGLELMAQLRAECPQVRILVVSMHDQSHWIELALRAGAHGFLPKDECPEQLVRAIRQVLEGKRFLSQRVMARLGGHFGSDLTMPFQTGSPNGSLKHPTDPPTDSPPDLPPAPPLPPPPRAG